MCRERFVCIGKRREFVPECFCTAVWALCDYERFCPSLYYCLSEQVELGGHLCVPCWEFSILLTMNIQTFSSAWAYVSEGHVPLLLGYFIAVNRRPPSKQIARSVWETKRSLLISFVVLQILCLLTVPLPC